MLDQRQEQQDIGYPKMAITLRREVHLSIDIHQPGQSSKKTEFHDQALHGPEGQSARGLHSCGTVQGSSRRSVTATLERSQSGAFHFHGV
jgi:hypothetical protein